MTATEMENPEATIEIETCRTEMKELFADYNRCISALFEGLQKQLGMIAAELADISQRLPRR
jgi:hypothetical protein